MHYTQADILPYLDRQTSHKLLNLSLTNGPFHVAHSPNGLYLGLCGQVGHCAVMRWKEQKLVLEFDVNDKVYDMTFFHTHEMFALAQQNSLHIYNADGMQMHNLRDVITPRYLTFLPYHFLLAMMCTGTPNRLKYLDVSVGEMVATHKMPSGVQAMTHNPANAVILAGHLSGMLTMWTPNMPDSVVAMATHPGAITGVAVAESGRYAATCGTDHTLRITDLRMLKEIEDLRVAQKAYSRVAYSQTGMLAAATARAIDVYTPDMKLSVVQRPCQQRDDYVSAMRFCPYEDFLTVGKLTGVTTLAVPNTGRREVDTFEQNIFETRRTLRESEVKKLLDKIPADMITLNPNVVGTVVPAKEKNVLHEVLEEMKDAEASRSEKVQKRRLAMKKRMQVFKEVKRPKPQAKRVKTKIKPIGQRSALDLFSN